VRINKNFRPSIFKVSLAREFLPRLIGIGPPCFRRFAVKIFPWKALSEIDAIVDIMYKTSTKVFEEKRRTLSQGDEAIMHQVGQGKDIMSTLRAFMIVSL